MLQDAWDLLLDDLLEERLTSKSNLEANDRSLLLTKTGNRKRNRTDYSRSSKSCRKLKIHGKYVIG